MAKVDTFDLELPADNSLATRLEWAGERAWDIAEGLITGEIGWFVWNVITGWGDLCTDDERKQYYAAAHNVAELLRSQQQ